MLRDVPANARFQCDKAAVFGAAIRDVLCLSKEQF